MPELGRAERALYLAADRVGKDGGAELKRCALAYAKALGSAEPFPGALRFTCERCGVPAVHAEHWYERVRGWCSRHTPWSGHYEHCGDGCEELCCT